MKLPDLNEKLRVYVEQFGTEDEELYPGEIPNAAAYDDLLQNIPLLDFPDKELERTYYFRWWTLRKHWHLTPHGHILTEFLPPVGWAGPYNSINCALGHHLREARWLKDKDGRVAEYIRFWLDGHGNALTYSTWFASAIEDYFSLHPDMELMRECLPKLDALYRQREREQLRSCGLFWSNDGYDGMEFSISGSGLRPTLNSYMCGDAFAIARMAEKTGLNDLAQAYDARGKFLKKKIDCLLWDDDFYRTIPCGQQQPAEFDARPKTPEEHRVRELIGYLPWYFHLASPQKDFVFRQLVDPEGFAAPFGLTTAEQRHPRFLFEHAHECLWNGYVWPYATAQTLTAAANAIRDHKDAPPLSNEEYFGLLRQYAASHRITGEDGNVRCWIDEDLHPFTGRWYARDVLKRSGREQPGGIYERGKDYNHSTFCDLVLSGLLGLQFDNGVLEADPLLPESCDHFLVTGLTQENWTVLFDKDGTHYGQGKGLQCFRSEPV